MNDISINGFALGGMRRQLYQLREITSCYLLNFNNVDHYLQMLLHEQPHFILGLGTHDSESDKILIETEFATPGNIAKPYLQPNQYFEFASGIGNPLCNLVSSRIMTEINAGNLITQYTFLHVPQSMSYRSVKIIDIALADFKSKL